MANFWQRAFNPAYVEQLEEAAAEGTQAAQALTGLKAQAYGLEMENTRLTEGLTDLMKFVEDIGWDRIDGFEQDKGFTMESLKTNAEVLRSILTANPTIKKAVNARYGYVWGRGVTLKNAPKKALDNARNDSVLFSDVAHWQLEAALATDGNVWVARDSRTSEFFLVPMDQLGGYISDPNDPTRVQYWLRSYTQQTKNYSQGNSNPDHIEVFYPAADYTGPIPARIDGITVDRNIRITHVTANRQSGWLLGVPDLFAAMFWTKAHKELFEAGTTFVKAQGKFASKVVSKTAAGAANAAARVADSPRRDESGQVLDYGGTAVMSGGLDMQLMGKMSGGVDFKAFEPVAGLIAAGLGIPLRVLLGDADSEEKSLEQSTVDEMVLRQKLWGWFYKTIFAPTKVEAIWPKIKTEPEYRRLQSVEIANKTNVLHRTELRQLTLEGFGLDGDPKDLPDIKEQPDVAIAKAKGDDAAKHAEAAAEQAADLAAQSTPEQGKDAGIGKLSTGKDANAARDNKSDKNVKR